jgi:glucokinase
MPIVNEPLLLGLEIGGTKLQLVAAASPGHILLRQRLVAERVWGAPAICEQIKVALERWGGIRWRAAGVGFGGPVDWRSGRICCSHQVDGWKDLNFRSWLENLIDAPVAVENDANLAALAEARYGAGYDFNPVFYTNSGSGVGGGLIVDGKIYHGALPGEAEFGHLRLERDGLTVEDYCSGWAVDRKIRELCDEEPLSELAGIVGLERSGEARHLAAALAVGNKAAKQIVEETASRLAFALSHVVHLFHPEVIVLGGGLALIGEPWRASVAQGLPGHLVAAFRPGPKVCLAALGEDVVPCGALTLAASLDTENVGSTSPDLDRERIS